MAFVNRSDKNATHLKASTSQNIGPGTYLSHSEYKIKHSGAPFNSIETRNGKKLKEKDIVPGPGAYEIDRMNVNEKVVVSSANDDFKIVEVPKPQSNFKSQTKRFVDKHKINEEVPGPGQYEALEPFKEIILKGQAHNTLVQKQNIIDKLMKMNRYQSTPSIPSKLQTYGYSESENNELQLNKMPVKQHTGVYNDSVGPGQYELKDCFEINKEKGAAWHKQKENRLKNPSSSHTLQVGPGTYDVQYVGLPLYKMKQSAGFASRTVRSMDGRRGKGPTQLKKSGTAKNGLSSVASASAQKTIAGMLDEEDSEEEIIEDMIPGPGHYFTEKEQSSIKLQKSNSYGNFGSLSKRFTAGPTFSNPIGPGEYNPSVSGVIGKNPHEIKKRIPPFQTTETRFLIKQIEEIKPGPGAYDPRVTVEEKLIQKIQRGYRGLFGSTDRRFKNVDVTSDQPGPGAYIQNLPQPDEDERIPAQNSVFKSASKRSVFNGMRDQKPPVGSYKVDYFDISKKVNEEPEDPDLKIKVPNLGFNTSEQRFKAISNKHGAIEEEDEELNAAKQNKKEEAKVVKESKHFNSKADRFNYKVKNPVPAPGQYHDNSTNQWSKRTFNIHFAEF